GEASVRWAQVAPAWVPAAVGGKALHPFLPVSTLSRWSRSRGPEKRSSGKDRFAISTAPFLFPRAEPFPVRAGGASIVWNREKRCQEGDRQGVQLIPPCRCSDSADRPRCRDGTDGLLRQERAGAKPGDDSSEENLAGLWRVQLQTRSLAAERGRPQTDPQAD